jgi:gliding motility-associated-like protein
VATLVSLHLSNGNGTLSPSFAAATTTYTASVANGVAAMTITPTATDPLDSISVNGQQVFSGSASQSLPLVVGPNTITITVTAEDKVTTKTYTLTVTEAESSNANLAGLRTNAGPLTPTFSPTTSSYTQNVANTVTSITVTPTTAVNTSTVTVNTQTVPSGTASTSIPLAVGLDTISVAVTAQDGTVKTDTLVVTRAAGSMNNFGPGISVTKPGETPGLADDGIQVHQAVSPNGDGINDFLQIDNISQYPDNKLSIMNRNGQLIYETSGYDNSSKVFDGHSNKNGQMQLPGTYFYQLDYTVKGISKTKIGFLVLKY